MLGRDVIKKFYKGGGKGEDDWYDDGIFEYKNEWRSFTLFHKDIIDFNLLVRSDYPPQRDRDAIKKAVVGFYKAYEEGLKEQPIKREYVKKGKRPVRIIKEDNVPFFEWIVERTGITRHFRMNPEPNNTIDLIANYEPLRDDALDEAMGKFAKIYLKEMRIPTK